MPSFGDKSTTRLETCHSDLQVVFHEVIREFDCSILCGHRDQVAHTIAFDDGKSQVQYPNSKPNSYPSMAADVAPYPYDGADEARFYYFAGFVMATAARLLRTGHITHALRWGGDWDGDTEVKDNNFDDLAHFELVAL